VSGLETTRTSPRWLSLSKLPVACLDVDEVPVVEADGVRSRNHPYSTWWLRRLARAGLETTRTSPRWLSLSKPPVAWP